MTKGLALSTRVVRSSDLNRRGCDSANREKRNRALHIQSRLKNDSQDGLVCYRTWRGCVRRGTRAEGWSELLLDKLKMRRQWNET
jgi:hypothetical protein